MRQLPHRPKPPRLRRSILDYRIAEPNCVVPAQATAPFEPAGAAKPIELAPSSYARRLHLFPSLSRTAHAEHHSSSSASPTSSSRLSAPPARSGAAGSFSEPLGGGLRS